LNKKRGEWFWLFHSRSMKKSEELFAPVAEDIFPQTLLLAPLEGVTCKTLHLTSFLPVEAFAGRRCQTALWPCTFWPNASKCCTLAGGDAE
jgi:hypothetical protein